MLLPLEGGGWQADLEEEGTAILKADRAMRGNAMTDKRDWFTEEQFALRREREVMSVSGRPIDRLVESGLYRREYNPLAGTRPTRRGRYSAAQDPWNQDSFDSFGWASASLPSYSRLDRLVEGGQHYTWDIMLPGKVRLNH